MLIAGILDLIHLSLPRSEQKPLQVEDNRRVEQQRITGKGKK
jgi:hypothetical protein